MPTCLPLAICIADKAMHEFCKQWFSGLQPCLSLETAPNGEIRVCSRVVAGDAVTTHPLDARHVDAGKASRRGPSYRRRQQRRAASRKAASARKIAADKAIQVALDLPAAMPLVTAAHAPEHFPRQPCPFTTDELCPDKDYLRSTQSQHLHHQHHLDHAIPQVDGHDDAAEQHQQEDEQDWINPNPDTGLWVCRCCTYAHSLPTEDDLKQHHDKLIFEYEECNICYPWHVWT